MSPEPLRPTPPVADLPDVPAAVVVLFALGPITSVEAVRALAALGVGAAVPLWVWVAGVLLFWSPLPISLPAVLIDTWRDATLPQLDGGILVRAWRGVRLLPAMLSPSHPAMLATLANVVGCLVATRWVLHLGLLPLPFG